MYAGLVIGELFYLFIKKGSSATLETGVYMYVNKQFPNFYTWSFTFANC